MIHVQTSSFLLCADFNDHGGWCRHTAKWWHSCLGLWGPADHPGPGKACHQHACDKIVCSPVIGVVASPGIYSELCIETLYDFVLQASIAAAQVSSSSPTVTLVQLPNGQTVQVHGVIQAAQPSVIQSPQVQTVQVRETLTSFKIKTSHKSVFFFWSSPFPVKQIPVNDVWMEKWCLKISLLKWNHYNICSRYQLLLRVRTLRSL